MNGNNINPVFLIVTALFLSSLKEVFIRRSYLQHGIAIGDNVVVIDAGANIGLFSLQCLREAKGAQVRGKK